MTNETELKELREAVEYMDTSDLQGYVWVLSSRIGISEDKLLSYAYGNITEKELKE